MVKVNEQEWRECNGVIRKTALELSDHGQLTATVFVEFAGGVGGFGQIGFDHLRSTPSGKDVWKPDGGACAYFLRRVLDVAGSDQWEKVCPAPVRLKLEGNASGTRIVAMGHYMEDNWFFIDDMKMPETYS